jgi:NAD(P)H-nitrite reductase large subunit
MDVRREVIEDAVKSGNLQTVEEIGEDTEAGTNCGACHDDLKDILLYVRKNS